MSHRKCEKCGYLYMCYSMITIWILIMVILIPSNNIDYEKIEVWQIAHNREKHLGKTVEIEGWLIAPDDYVPRISGRYIYELQDRGTDQVSINTSFKEASPKIGFVKLRGTVSETMFYVEKILE